MGCWRVARGSRVVAQNGNVTRAGCFVGVIAQSIVHLGSNWVAKQEKGLTVVSVNP